MSVFEEFSMFVFIAMQLKLQDVTCDAASRGEDPTRRTLLYPRLLRGAAGPSPQDFLQPASLRCLPAHVTTLIPASLIATFPYSDDALGFSGIVYPADPGCHHL